MLPGFFPLPASRRALLFRYRLPFRRSRGHRGCSRFLSPGKNIPPRLAIGFVSLPVMLRSQSARGIPAGSQEIARWLATEPLSPPSRYLDDRCLRESALFSTATRKKLIGQLRVRQTSVSFPYVVIISQALGIDRGVLEIGERPWARETQLCAADQL